MSVSSVLPIIVIDDLYVHYQEMDRPAVNGVKLRVQPGECFGLLGPNGAGKTTILSCLEGIQGFQKGTIKVDGLDVKKKRAKVKGLLGIQLQHSSLFPDLKVLEQIQFYTALYGRFLTRKKAREYLKQFKLKDKATSWVDLLSGGEKHRLTFILAIAHEPKIVLLDEPTAGIDLTTKPDIWEHVSQLRKDGTTLILTTHDMQEAQLLCQHFAIIDKGKMLASGSLQELITDELPRDNYWLARAMIDRDSEIPLPEVPPELAIDKYYEYPYLTLWIAKPQRTQQLDKLLKEYIRRIGGSNDSLLTIGPPNLEDVFHQVTRKDKKEYLSQLKTEGLPFWDLPPRRSQDWLVPVPPSKTQQLHTQNVWQKFITSTKRTLTSIVQRPFCKLFILISMIVMTFRKPQTLFFNMLMPTLALLVYSVLFGHYQIPFSGSCLSYSTWVLPGVIVTNIIAMGLIGNSGAMIVWRERGIFKGIQVTPTPIWQVMFARVLSQILVAIIQAAVVITLSIRFFNFPFNFHYLPLTLAFFVLGSVVFLSFGQVIASFANRVEIGNVVGQGLNLILSFGTGVLLPLGMFSGTVSDTVAKAAIYTPSYMIGDLLRWAMLEGTAGTSPLLDIGGLLAYFVASMVISALFFRTIHVPKRQMTEEEPEGPRSVTEQASSA